MSQALAQTSAAEANASPAPECGYFHSATQTLSVWLDSNNFHYSLDAVQRGYEWKQVQVDGLLDTIAQVYKKCNNREDDAVVKLSEVVVLEMPRDRKNLLESLAVPRWYERGGCNTGARNVAVIDGQQRITTVAIIAAVTQWRLLKLVNQQLWVSPADIVLQHKAIEAVKNLETKFTYAGAGGRRRLLLFRHTDGQAGLANGIFDFCSEDGGNVNLAEVLSLTHVRKAQSRYEQNAMYCSRWFDRQLDSCKPRRGAENADVEKARLQISWLCGFLQVLLHRVLWTTTLTFSKRLALDTFVNVNLDRHRVTLSEWDVVKVALVANLENERHLDTALIEWDKCLEKLSSVAKQLADEEPKFPYFSLLSKGRLTDGSAADALMLDFLRHVCFIQRAASGADSPVPVANIEDGLVQHFAEYRTSTGSWNARDYIKGTLLQYVWAFCTMLTFSGHSEMRSHGSVNKEAKVSLSILLSLADTAWRPAALAIFREISKDGMPMEATDSKHRLLAHALKQLECVALRLAARSKTTAVAKAHAWMAIVKKITRAGASDDRDGKLIEAIGRAPDKPLMREAFAVVANLPSGHTIVNNEEALFEDLFGKDLYPDRGSLATAVLLGIELSERLSKDSRDGGIHSESFWEGKMTLEHLLPQNPDAADEYWKERFGAPGSAAHEVFKHKLGNLCILTPRVNSLLSNRDFDAKLILLKGLRIDMRTLDYVKTQCTERGWGICAIMSRQEDLLQKLAARYNITVADASWRSWRAALLKQFKQKSGTLAGLLVSDSTRQAFAGDAEIATSGTEPSPAAGAEYESSARFYVRALALNPKATAVWSYLRTSLTCAGRDDLQPAVEAQDLAALQQALPLE